MRGFELFGQRVEHAGATIVAASLSESLQAAGLVILLGAVWAVPMFIGRRRRLAR